jgi:hypothetical protein
MASGTTLAQPPSTMAATTLAKYMRMILSLAGMK